MARLGTMPRERSAPAGDAPAPPMRPDASAGPADPGLPPPVGGAGAQTGGDPDVAAARAPPPTHWLRSFTPGDPCAAVAHALALDDLWSPEQWNAAVDLVDELRRQGLLTPLVPPTPPPLDEWGP